MDPDYSNTSNSSYLSQDDSNSYFYIDISLNSEVIDDSSSEVIEFIDELDDSSNEAIDEVGNSSNDDFYAVARSSSEVIVELVGTGFEEYSTHFILFFVIYTYPSYILCHFNFMLNNSKSGSSNYFYINARHNGKGIDELVGAVFE
ncbi:36328_t:CDS:2 [Gigaspora margarita]|uniref:36328_t:CDS:1 n=1 Tax=Gigaspora margarita TaxID=4874 RepID=A0ABM8VVT2_GIGMA|nr:36328_t:CDS:2 [Gigaspora margarita]